jgi:hypothetical protein
MGPGYPPVMMMGGSVGPALMLVLTFIAVSPFRLVRGVSRLFEKGFGLTAPDDDRLFGPGLDVRFDFHHSSSFRGCARRVWGSEADAD